MVDWPANPSDGDIYEEGGSSWIFNDPPSVWKLRSVVATSHSTLTNLGSDDHLQYHNDARGIAQQPPAGTDQTITSQDAADVPLSISGATGQAGDLFVASGDPANPDDRFVVDAAGNVTTSGVYLGGTAADNYLDTYETGTFTATLSLDSTVLMTSPANSCTYTKVGNLVYYNINFDDAPYTARGATTGFARINGLPFVRSSGGRAICSGLFQIDTVFTGPMNRYGTNIGGTQYIEVYYVDTELSDGVRENDLGNTDKINTYLRMQGTYIAD